jgi:hypothetical protein
MFSCSNEQELKPEVKILREDWHRLVDIDFVAQNEPIQNSVQNFIAENDLGKGYSLAFSKETIHFNDGSISQVFLSFSNSDNFLVVSLSKLSGFKYFYLNQVDEAFSFRSKETTLFEFDSSKRKLVTAKTNYPGNCNAIGPPRQGEDYGDCFLRNWDNFCCDFSGCATQFAMAGAIAIAIGIDCAQAL